MAVALSVVTGGPGGASTATNVSGGDDSSTLLAAYTKAANGARTVTGISDPAGTAIIDLGAGTYNITQLQAMMTISVPTTKVSGIWFRASGKRATVISYSPGTSGALCQNMRWLNFKFTDCTFLGNDSNSNFMNAMEQAGLTNIQDGTFLDCEWSGAWQYIFRLTGGNNNSEWKVTRCTNNSSALAWVYSPPSLACTITSGSSTIACTNTSDQAEIGDTGFLSAAVAPLAANTQYYVVGATTTGIQIATTSAQAGGVPVTFTANATPTFTTASDQFLNFWFHDCKFDVGTNNSAWLILNYGGSVKITNPDVSNYKPTAATYLFNLLGATHSQGVQNFECSGLRIEHGTDNALLMHSQWSSGQVIFNNIDSSSQVGLRTITNQYCKFEIINARGPVVQFNGGSLMGCHNYVNNTSNSHFQHSVQYQGITLLDNPTAADFIVMTNNGNSGGFPVIDFDKCRNTLDSSVVGYREIVDCSLNWMSASGRSLRKRYVNLVGSNSDFPFNATPGAANKFRLPRGCMATKCFYFNQPGSAAGGAYQYVAQTEEATPTVLIGGVGTLMAGANATTPLLSTSMYVTNPNYILATDLARTIDVIDQTGRTGIFTGPTLVLEYIG